jgi:tetratricopeptide (TPR) repeat protein
MNTNASTNRSTLFEDGKLSLENKDYTKAAELFNRLVQEDSSCWEAWNNLGLAYCELQKYDDAVEAYMQIRGENRTSRTWFNIGIAEYYRHKYQDAVKAYEKAVDLTPQDHPNSLISDVYFNLGVLRFEIGDIKGADRDVIDALKHNESLASAWALKGRICIENDECEEAIKCFHNAIAVGYATDLTSLIWEAYARYLKAEFSAAGEREQQLVSVIRKLERVDSLAEKLSGKDTDEINSIRAHALYFLACSYCKLDDHLTSKRKLEECISLNTGTPIHILAHELLDNLWDTKMRPPWWRWWQTSTSRRIARAKKVIFLLLAALTILMILILFAHPFIATKFPGVSIQWNVYLLTVALLIVIILSPSIEQIKAKDFEVKVQAPTSLEIIPSSAQMEQRLGAMQPETILTA